MTPAVGKQTASTAVVHLSALQIDRGAAVLVGDQPVAVFRISTNSDESAVYAVSHLDPRTDAPVMARGLVGSVADRPVVVSPLHKERYDLRTGECIDNQDLSLQTYGVRIEGSSVVVHGK